MQKIETKEAPSAIGPYSQAVKISNLLFVSGQIPINPQTGLMADNIEEQTKQVFSNIGAILKEAGLSYEKIVKTTVFLKDMNDFQVVNGIYGSYFSGDIFPARCAVEVSKLPKNSLIEIECIASFE